MEPSLPEKPIDSENQEHLDRLADGAVLLARDVLQDPNFIAALVLICVYSKDAGAYGLVLNRPSHMPLSEIFDGFNEANEQRRVFIGGPVEQDELQIVQITDEPVADSHAVAPRVYLGGKWEDIGRLLTLDAETTKLFLGYSGWAPRQLEGEIEAGAWDVYSRIDLEKLLGNIDKTLAADVATIAAFLETIRA